MDSGVSREYLNHSAMCASHAIWTGFYRNLARNFRVGWGGGWGGGGGGGGGGVGVRREPQACNTAVVDVIYMCSREHYYCTIYGGL